MGRWFLSYHSTDEAVAARLKGAIEQHDAASRVFFAPTHMRAGGSWSAQLAEEIAEADAFILLIGKEVDPWEVLEYDEALDRWAKAQSDFPLVVILREGQTAPGLPFLRRLHWIITADPASEKAVGRIFAEPKLYEPLGTAELIREQSRQRFGRSRAVIERQHQLRF